MLCNNHPAITYVSWYGLVIVTKTLENTTNPETGEIVTVENETPYIITNGRSCMKYIYWEEDNNPFVLKESNEWITETSTRKMIYINDNGTGTEVPHSDISVYYNDTGSGNGGATKLAGEALGKFDELNNKYMTIVEDVNGIKETLGSTESGSGNSLIERINTLEKTAEGTTEKISTVEKQFVDNKELEALRNNINTSIIDVGIALSEYEESVSEMSKDMEVSSEEKSDISVKQNALLDAYTVLSQYHQTLITRLQNSEEDNSVTVSNLNNGLTDLNVAISNLNKIVNTAISDNTIVPSEVTTMLNALANVSLRNNNYKNTVSDAILLGVGGRLTEAVLDIKKTSNEFTQTISKVVEEIDGETGLKVQVAQNATAIKQTSEEIALSYVKYNEATAQLTVGDNIIKLDAGKVLMTGTLTWDSLDDTAKQNLKGADGTAEYVMLIGDQIFKYDKDLNPNVTYITLSAQISNIENPTYDWYYRNDNGAEWTHISSNTNLSSFTLRHDDSIWGSNTNSITIRVTCNGLSDDMTVVKLYDGVFGQDSKTVTVNGEQLFRYNNDFTGTPSPTSITLNGYKNNITSTASRWYYRISDTSSWTEITSSRGSDSLTIPHDSNYFGSSKILMIRYEVETYSDVISIAKISDGANGYFVLLTNENHSIPCDENGSYTASALNEAYTYVRAYKGLDEVSFSLTKVDSGCISVYNTSTKRLEITSLTNNIATVTMNITIDGVVFQKVMTITKSIKGEKGEEGTGVNVLGQLDSVSQLPSTGTPGDAYIIDGLIYVWSENTNGWSDGVPFRGEQGLPGKDGADGRTTYLHIKYSNDGKTFTSNNGEDPGDWLGQYTDYIETDSSTFSDYTWKKIRGEDGDNGIVANLTNDNHIVPTESDGTLGSTSFEGCSSKISLSYIGVELNTGVTYGYTASTGITGNWDSNSGTYTVTGWSGDSDTAYVDLKATYNGVTYTKRFTLSKAKKPLDSYTIILTNESHTFAGDTSNALNGSTTCGIIAYRGTQLVPVTVGTISGVPTGMSVSITNNNSTSARLNISVTTSMVTRNGTLNIPITVGVSSFTKIFTYSISFKGSQGEPGIPGKDGKDGNSVRVLGRYNTLAQLKAEHSTGNENGDGYIVDKNLYVWTDTDFIDVGQFQGEDGKPSYVHIKYSNDGVSFTGNSGEDVGTWMGVYADTILADSTNFSDYKWSKIKGGDAMLLSITANRQAIAFNSDNTPKDSTAITLTAVQQNFSNGISWSTSPSVTLSGTGLTRTLSASSFTNNNKITVTITSGSLSDTVTLVKVMDGDSGEDAYTINLSNDNHTFIANASGNIETQQATTTVVTAYKGTTPVTPSFGTLPTVNGLTISRSGTTITIIAPTGGNLATHGSFNIPVVIDGITFNQAFSYSKVNCGEDGEDGYTVILTNEAHIFPCENNGNISTAISTTTQVKAFKGTTSVTPTIGTLPSVTGLTLSKSGTTITIQANVGTSLASSGSFNIPITVDGISFTKTFSWSKSFKGDKGDGSDVNIPSWITEWDNGKTTINGSTVLTPKLFAGTVTNSVPTGVAIGKNVFGTSGSLANVSGIVGYKSGTKTYEFNTNGNVLIGSSSGKHISWDGSTLEVVADTIKLGNSTLASQQELADAIDNIKIGGTNLVRNSNFANGDNNWSLRSGVSIDENKYIEEGGASLYISKSGLTSDAWTGATQTIMSNYTANEEFTISFWYYVENKSTFDGNLCLEVKGTNSGGSQVGISTAYATPSQLVQGKWTRVSKTIKGSANLTNVFVYPYINRNGTVWITDIQVERGNKLTDWSPNGYDSIDSMAKIQDDLMQVIEDSRSYLQIDDNGVSIVSQGTSVKIKTENDINAMVEEFNNRFSALESGEGFEMVFDKKYTEYGVGEAVETSKQVTDHIDFSNGSIKLYGDSSNFSLTISQDKMAFQQYGYDIAWMSTDILYIRDGEFTNSLRLGNFKWIPRDNGNLSFIHI